MKEYGWPLEKALNEVKEKRNCITPNKGFIAQLRTYAGMLTASGHRNNQLFNSHQTAADTALTQQQCCYSAAPGDPTIKTMHSQIQQDAVVGISSFLFFIFLYKVVEAQWNKDHWNSIPWDLHRNIYVPTPWNGSLKIFIPPGPLRF